MENLESLIITAYFYRNETGIEVDLCDSDDHVCVSG